MRHGIFPMFLAILLACSWAFAGGKGKSWGRRPGTWRPPARVSTHPSGASRNFYGSGRANRGNGYRNSMGNNRMMHRSRPVRNLNTLAVGYAASPNDRNILRNGLMGVAQGGIRPPSSAVQQLSGGLISHLPSRRTPITNTERLSLDLEAVMNGNHLGRP